MAWTVSVCLQCRVQGLQLCLWITKQWGPAVGWTDRLNGSSGTAQGSTLLSRELWSTHEGRRRLEKSPPSCVVKSPNFCWKYRKCFIPWGNLGCWLEQGRNRARWDGITSHSSVDLSHYPCVVDNAPAVRCNRRVWASNMPCRHLRKKHTHACLDAVSLWGPAMHFPASYANSNPITTKGLTLPKDPQTLDVVHSLNVLTLKVKCVSCSSPQDMYTSKRAHEQKIHFHV